MTSRAQCPVLTCTRSMPAGQVMCAHCWAKVPTDIRRQIDRAKGAPSSGHRQGLIAMAISAAQGASS